MMLVSIQYDLGHILILAGLKELHITYTATPNIRPTAAVSTIAMVPHNDIRKTALNTLEPPVLAAMAPSNIKKAMVKPY